MGLAFGWQYPDLISCNSLMQISLVSIAFCINHFFQTPPYAKAQVTFHCTSKYWNESVKHFCFNLNYITLEHKLSKAESGETYLIQLNAKCFPAL